MNLLEKAKTIDKKRPQVIITDEHIDLAIAYIKGEISIASVSMAMGHRQGAQSAYTTLARSLKAAYEKGKLSTV